VRVDKREPYINDALYRAALARGNEHNACSDVPAGAGMWRAYVNAQRCRSLFALLWQQNQTSHYRRSNARRNKIITRRHGVASARVAPEHGVPYLLYGIFFKRILAGVDKHIRRFATYLILPPSSARSGAGRHGKNKRQWRAGGHGHQAGRQAGSTAMTPQHGAYHNITVTQLR